MNIIIVDDEKVYLQSIERKLNDWCHKNAQCSGIMLYSFTSSEDAADEIRKGLQVDAAFLDIEIPGEIVVAACAVRGIQLSLVHHGITGKNQRCLLLWHQ